MKINPTRIINLNNGIFKESYSRRYHILFFATMLGGIVGGVLLQTVNHSVNSKISQQFEAFVKINADKSFFELVAGNVFYNFLYLVLPLFFGVSAIGYAFMYLVPLFKGLGIGATCALIYSMFGIRGIGYCAVLIYPVALLQLFVILLSCNESYHMSSEIFALLRKRNTADEIRINLFFLRYAVIALILFMSSVVFAVCNLLFFKIIS